MFSKQIAYTYHWPKSMIIAASGGLLAAALMILLQPFDTNQHTKMCCLAVMVCVLC